MSKWSLNLMLILITLLVAPINAAFVQYYLSVDDYGDLYIDGQLEAHYDAYPQGGDMTDVLDLSPGWHDIDILIKNRWGSSSVGLLTAALTTGDLTIVPLADLRSLNAQGQYVSGLKAEYYTSGGTTLYKTVYGEGPIWHVSGGDTGYRPGFYQGVRGPIWVGLWDKFEERLSGQIFVAPIPTPESVTIDIKPGSYPNSINLGSQGLVPVAILSSENFDATNVDPDTVELAGADVAVRGKSNKYMAHEEDLNGDGLIDLVVQVSVENLDPDSFQDGLAILTGSTYDGQAIEGWDEITIVPPEQ
jgi:hypothetical protein